MSLLTVVRTLHVISNTYFSSLALALVLQNRSLLFAYKVVSHRVILLEITFSTSLSTHVHVAQHFVSFHPISKGTVSHALPSQPHFTVCSDHKYIVLNSSVSTHRALLHFTISFCKLHLPFSSSHISSQWHKSLDYLNLHTTQRHASVERGQADGSSISYQTHGMRQKNWDWKP